MSFDFSPIIDALSAEDAPLRDYPESPFETEGVELHPSLHWPRFDGDPPYVQGPRVIDEEQIDIPQALIKAKRQSFHRAMTLLMPQELLNAWMVEFFHGNYSDSPYLQTVMHYRRMPEESHGQDDETHAFDLTAPERRRTDRRLFTKSEIRAVLQYAEHTPELLLSVLAYQAAFLGYAKELRNEIDANTDIAPLIKDRALMILDNAIIPQFEYSRNFVSNHFLAIGVSALARNNMNMDGSITEEDYKAGTNFVLEMGGFEQDVWLSENERRSFSCPAKGMVTRTTAVDVETPETRPNYTEHTGTLLYHISQHIDPTILADNASKPRFMQEIEKLTGDLPNFLPPSLGR